MNKEIMESLLGRNVKVDRGGHNSRVGKVLEVGEDFFVLLTKEDGVLYYKDLHVKSVTDNARKGFELNLVIPKDFKYVKGNSFKDVLEGLLNKWITVNRDGHEKYEGVLNTVNDEYVTVVADEEVIVIAMFHIHNVSYGLKVEVMEKEEDQEDKKSGKR